MADRDFDASEQLLDQVRQALADDRPLCIQGSDSKAFLGRIGAGERLDTRVHCGIVSYEPTELVITARAFGPNAHRPIPVRVGDREQLLTLGEDLSTTTLHFTNPAGEHTLTIAPPEPQQSNVGNITGQDPRRLGIGMVDIRIVPQS